MNHNRWLRLEELFSQAVEMPIEERDRFASETCADDPDLRNELLSLLAADADYVGSDDPERQGPQTRPVEPLSRRFGRGSTRENQPSNDPPDLALSSPTALEGRRIGPYRVIRHLGSGAMSSVHLAVRDDGEFRQGVAIKLIKPTMLNELVLKRFLRERQILAGLDHPNIARLLDGGTTDDGHPYIVMEYVDGTDLYRYCDSNRLTIADRLWLFRAVCSAVHFAHQNLVVHRDIKPSNILVTSGGIPKLLDFGIAKLLHIEEGEAPSDGTTSQVRLMTPRYASPEQVRGEPITTATDVYSLGVVLYELLSGRRLHSIGNDGARRLQRLICDVEPEAPSKALNLREDRQQERTKSQDAPVAAIGPTADWISEHRASTPDKLRRMLAGDLDTIVLKAVRKEPLRRYRSADELSKDIWRHLHRLPVFAQKDTLRYRTGKFIRRHTTGVVAAGLVTSALIVGMLTTAQQARVALAERARAEQISALLVDLFEVSDPGESQGSTITAREVLDRGADRITRELESQPEARAAFMDTIAVIYRKLGLYEQAYPLQKKALDTRLDLLGEHHPDVARSLEHMAHLQMFRGDYGESETLHRRALAIRREAFGSVHLEVATSATNLAELLLLAHKRDIPAAESLAREAVAIRRQLLGSEHPDTAEALHDLAAVLFAKGAYEKAEELLREAADIIRESRGSRHPSLAIVLGSWGAVLSTQGDLERAESLFMETLEIEREVLGEDHPGVAATLNNLAYIKGQLGSFPAAEDLFQESLRARRRHYGDVHPNVRLSLFNLAFVMVLQGKFDDAEPLIEETQRVLLMLEGERSAAGADLDRLRGLWYYEKGDLQASETWLRKALALRREISGEDDPILANFLEPLARVVHEMGRFDEAASLHRQALERRRGALGDEHTAVAQSLEGLAGVYYDQGELHETERLARRSVALMRKLASDGHPFLAGPLVLLGSILVDQGNPRAAEPLLREALDIRRRTRGADDWQLAVAETAMGACLAALGRTDQAEPLLRKSYDTLRRTRGSDSVQTDRAAGRLHRYYAKNDRPNL